MPVDIETELVQLWAGSRVITHKIQSMLPANQNSLTFSSTGLRSGRDNQLAGLAQILQLAQSFTLEIAIKALYRKLNPKSNPEATHDLSKLFDALNKDIKIRLNSGWEKAIVRTPAAQKLTFDEFLNEYRLSFEESRYLYERHRSYIWNSMDFDIAIWLIVGVLVEKQPDGTVLSNLYNTLSKERGGLLDSLEAQPSMGWKGR